MNKFSTITQLYICTKPHIVVSTSTNLGQLPPSEVLRGTSTKQSAPDWHSSQTHQFLPLFGQNWRLQEFLADLESLQLQSYGAGVGGNCTLRNAQLFLQDCSIGRLSTVSWTNTLFAFFISKHCCAQLILQKMNTARWTLDAA